MGPAKKYILLNTLIAVIILFAYSAVMIVQFQKEQRVEAGRDLERALAMMGDLLAAKGPFRSENGKLFAGDYLINGNDEIPDRIGEVFGGAATIFLHDVRIATSIRTGDGRRATGTRLVGPPFTAVIGEGRKFRGEAHILGLPYLTAYDPIRDSNGRLIGALFAGVKKSQLTAAVQHLHLQLSLLVLLFLAALLVPAVFMIRLSVREAEKDRLLMQQNRQAVMGEMIGNIAHQWRQPLNTLALIAQGMLITRESGGVTEEFVRDRVGRISDLIRHMSQTIDEFTRFFRPEKKAVTFSPNRVIESTLRLVEASMKNAGIEVRTTVNAQVPIAGYPNEYSQVVMNIVMNSRDAFDLRNIPQPRTIELEIGAEGDRSVVTITDNAGGIPGEVLQRIFDPYFTTKGAMGTGIGLYLAKTIVEENMGGRLIGRNAERGASFRIEVPVGNQGEIAGAAQPPRVK